MFAKETKMEGARLSIPFLFSIFGTGVSFIYYIFSSIPNSVTGKANKALCLAVPIVPHPCFMATIIKKSTSHRYAVENGISFFRAWLETIENRSQFLKKVGRFSKNPL